MARLRETRPLLRTSLAEVDPPESFSLLHRGETDVVISADTVGTPGPAGDEGRSDGRFHRVALCEDLFDIALPEGHRLLSGKRLVLADLADETWIFATANSRGRSNTVINWLSPGA
ncbi:MULTISPECIES: LysR substrate-binding domain-containing protein [unclassified Streptomyces]|uniref:LysR substrate-binding domain-containing protein n=1 Tax=unclassified Streptomyces TaxID=2593676 RepID=UPI001F5B7F5B|nr:MULTISPECIES: LysR substrate-binding domain-containing protein [unclassified Streptomyces]